MGSWTGSSHAHNYQNVHFYLFYQTRTRFTVVDSGVTTALLMLIYHLLGTATDRSRQSIQQWLIDLACMGKDVLPLLGSSPSAPYRLTGSWGGWHDVRLVDHMRGWFISVRLYVTESDQFFRAVLLVVLDVICWFVFGSSRPGVNNTSCFSSGRRRRSWWISGKRD